MLIQSGCKINLGLQIISKRADGYHNINSLCFPLNWQDIIELLVVPQQKEPIILKTSGLKINTDSTNNTIYKVLNLLKAQFKLPPIFIHIHKNIPMGAGLGGGSANAAMVLKYLQQHLLKSLSDEVALTLLSKIGSDCAFFWNAQPAIVRGTGTELQAISLSLQGYYLVLVYPHIHISTAWAYAQCSPKPPLQHIENIVLQPVYTWKNVLHNDFEEPVFKAFPLLKDIKHALYHHGALYASLSGSGSTLYGIFKETPDLTAFSMYSCYTEQVQ